MSIERVGMDDYADPLEKLPEDPEQADASDLWDFSTALAVCEDNDVVLVDESGDPFGEDEVDDDLAAFREQQDMTLEQFREDVEIALAELHVSTVASVRDLRERIGVEGLDDFGYPIDGPDEYETGDRIAFQPSLADVERHMRLSEPVDAVIVED